VKYYHGYSPEEKLSILEDFLLPFRSELVYKVLFSVVLTVRSCAAISFVIVTYDTYIAT